MAEVVIDRLGSQGDGIAPGPVYAPRTLPGETVTGTLEGERLSDVRVVTPSVHRVRAGCAHYGSCGGCALMHADDRFVATWKRETVVAALAREGVQAEVLEAQVSAPRARRRVAFSGRRTKRGALVGFHGRASVQIVDVPECQVVDPALLATLPQLRDITQLAASRSASLKLHLTLTDVGVDLAVTDAKPLDGPKRAALAQFGGAFARLTWNGETVLLAKTPVVTLGQARVVPPPGAFLQATAEGEVALQRVALETCAGAKRIVDLFSGIGTFTFPLAKEAAVHAVEGAGDLVDALQHGVRHSQGLKPITYETRDLFRDPLLPEELEGFDAAVIDPPRAGALEQTRNLALARVQSIAAISCNPVTFARDVALLVAQGYRLGPVAVIDQFRWSPHIEVAAPLTLETP